MFNETSEVGKTETLPNQGKGILLVVAGPTAVGKNTVVEKIQELYKQRNPPVEFTRIVAYTDREPRPGEVQGVDYNFVTKDIFSIMADEGKFLDPGTYGEGRSAYKKDAFESTLEGNNSIAIINMYFANWFPEFLTQSFGDKAGELLGRMVLVIIGAPSLTNLKDRYLGREAGKRSTLLPRLRADWKSWNTYKDSFPNVVINETGKLDQTVSAIANIIDKKVVDITRQ